VKRLIFISAILFLACRIFAQQTNPPYKVNSDTIKGIHVTPDSAHPMRVPARVVGNDTLPVIDLSPSVVYPKLTRDMRRELEKFDRLVYNVRIVYPYAKLAGIKLREYQKVLDTIHSEKGRKAFIKKAEKQLEDQFGDNIRDLSFSQGKILIKLVYRETGNSTYDLVKELRGKFTAFVWQTMAKLFGYDLKTQYDPEGEDQAIEHIVKLIEAGVY
jgi:hypothetical protein